MSFITEAMDAFLKFQVDMAQEEADDDSTPVTSNDFATPWTENDLAKAVLDSTKSGEGKTAQEKIDDLVKAREGVSDEETVADINDQIDLLGQQAQIDEMQSVTEMLDVLLGKNEAMSPVDTTQGAYAGRLNPVEMLVIKTNSPRLAGIKHLPLEQVIEIYESDYALLKEAENNIYERSDKVRLNVYKGRDGSLRYKNSGKKVNGGGGRGRRSGYGSRRTYGRGRGRSNRYY